MLRRDLQKCFLLFCRWLQGELDELVTEERWGYYLNLFDEAIWPNGELKSKQPEKSAKEKMKTKKEAIKTLVDFFPGINIQLFCKFILWTPGLSDGIL